LRSGAHHDQESFRRIGHLTLLYSGITTPALRGVLYSGFLADRTGTGSGPALRHVATGILLGASATLRPALSAGDAWLLLTGCCHLPGPPSGAAQRTLTASRGGQHRHVNICANLAGTSAIHLIGGSSPRRERWRRLFLLAPGIFWVARSSVSYEWKMIPTCLILRTRSPRHRRSPGLAGDWRSARRTGADLMLVDFNESGVIRPLRRFVVDAAASRLFCEFPIPHRPGAVPPA